MSIEGFNGPKRKGVSLFKGLRRAIDRLASREESNEREVFSSDGSRKWVFYKWEWGEGVKSGQLNAALVVRIGDSWVGLMRGMMRWEENDEPRYGLEVSGVSSTGQDKMYYYDHSTGGYKRFSGMTANPMGISSSEAMVAMLEEGILQEAALPEYVDFEATIKLFLDQARRLDFSTPALIEKPLLR